MPFAFFLLIIGLVIAFWRVIVVVAVVGGIAYGLFKLMQKIWNGWTEDLERQERTEAELKDLWERFSDKPIVAELYQPLMLVPYFLFLIPLPFVAAMLGDVVTNGWLQVAIKSLTGGQQFALYGVAWLGIYFAVWAALLRFHNWREPDCPRFGRYGLLRAYADSEDPKTVLERAPALRRAARQRFWGPRAFHRTAMGNQRYADHPAYYDSDRLVDLLVLLEKHYPLTDPDDMFRYRYWNYAQPIWQLLSLRKDERARRSMFGAAYPENPEKVAQEAAAREETEREQRRNRLAAERAQMAEERGPRTEPVTTIADALRIIGVAAIPDANVLIKLERVMMEKAGEGEKEELALAFRVLKAVESSSAQPERA